MVEQRPARPVREIAVHAGFAFEMQHQQGHGHAMFKQPSCRARHGNRVNFTRYFIIEHVEQPVVSHACDPTDRHISIGLEHLKLKTGPDIHGLAGGSITDKAGLDEAERLEKDRVGSETEIGTSGFPQRH